jgi:nucleotide-binding universal stress UspA family protein
MLRLEVYRRMALNDTPGGLQVLWPTDGSDSSRNAIPLLRHLVLPAAERIVVLSIAPHSLISGARPDPALLQRVNAAARRRALVEAEQLAQRDVTALDPIDVEVATVSRWGNPIQEVLRVARSESSDLVVMGAKGHSNLGLILLGSVSQGVVQHATLPVLIARPGSDQVTQVLVGFDGSPHARRSLEFLKRFKLPLDTLYRLTYVIEPFVVPPGMPAAYRRRAQKEAHEINQRRDEHAEKLLAEMALELRDAGRRVETELLRGQAGPALDEAARRHHADLVVVGSRKPAPARHYLLGTTAEKLVRHSHTSVLVVR